ncbi:MAG: peptide ABC transporter substrate-binding protein [Coriobacteriales bacterium]|nr:peptide ABC transporter substrate-binding protein [Actinomycetes bacterium]
MSDRIRKSLALSLALVMVLAVAGMGGCAPETTETTDGGTDGTITKGGTMSFYIGEPAYIDPYNTQESEGTEVEQCLFDSLTRVDPLDPTKLMPAAAESWESNADATVWTFRLRKDAKFSDGTPVTAKDFVYAWNRIVNPNTVNTLTGKVDASIISYHLAFVQGYDDVVNGKATEMSGLKAVDDSTFEVTLSQAFADFAFVVAHPALAPVPQAAVENGVDYNGTKVAFGDFPVGNGPFKMAEPWKHNQYIKIVKNENYVGDQPYIDGVDFKIYKDTEAAYTDFEAGNLDFAPIGEGKIKLAQEKYGTSDDGYTVNPGKQVVLGAENATYYLIFNEKDKVFSNADIRKAVSMAINRQAICDTVFEGTREPADNIVPPGIAGYEKGAWEFTKYDVEAAKKALADAGYPEGKGLPTIKLSFNSGAGHEKIMELIQSDLKKIGINAVFDSADFPVYLKQLDAGDFQLGRLGWIADYPIMDNFLYPLFQSKAGDNKSAYSNPEVDKALDEARTITDDAARIKAYQDINAIVQANVPVAPLMFYKHTRVGSSRIHDFVWDAQGLGDFTKVWIEAGK